MFENIQRRPNALTEVYLKITYFLIKLTEFACFVSLWKFTTVSAFTKLRECDMKRVHGKRKEVMHVMRNSDQIL